MSSSWFVLLIFVFTIGFNTLGQTWLKLGANNTPPQSAYYLLAGLTAYALSTVTYIKVLGKFNLSFAYPVVIGLTVVATTLSGALLLREKVAMGQWMGIGLVLSGIFAIALAKSA
jgi:small multidrug resistance pump